MDKGFRAWHKARTENRVNIENCIKHQKEIDAHPKFWERIDGEKIATLNEILRLSEKRIRVYTSKKSLTGLEAGLLVKAQKFVEIATA